MNQKIIFIMKHLKTFEESVNERNNYDDSDDYIYNPSFYEKGGLEDEEEPKKNKKKRSKPEFTDVMTVLGSVKSHRSVDSKKEEDKIEEPSSDHFSVEETDRLYTLLSRGLLKKTEFDFDTRAALAGIIRKVKTGSGELDFYEFSPLFNKTKEEFHDFINNVMYELKNKRVVKPSDVGHRAAPEFMRTKIRDDNRYR